MLTLLSYFASVRLLYFYMFTFLPYVNLFQYFQCMNTLKYISALFNVSELSSIHLRFSTSNLFPYVPSHLQSSLVSHSMSSRNYFTRKLQSPHASQYGVPKLLHKTDSSGTYYT